MSEVKHTPGQVEIIGASHLAIFGPHGANICSVSSPRATSEVRHSPLQLGDPDWDEACANAKRLQLCWNSHDTLQQQRDALLLACKAAKRELRYLDDQIGFDPNSAVYRVLNEIDAAIALCEPEEQPANTEARDD